MSQAAHMPHGAQQWQPSASFTPPAIHDDAPFTERELQALIDSVENLMADRAQYGIKDDQDSSVTDDELANLLSRLHRKHDALFAPTATPKTVTSASTPVPTPYPFYHRSYAQGMTLVDEAQRQLLAGWYEIADKLKAMPAGTQAQLMEDGKFVGTLLMAPMNGELYMFWATPGALYGEPEHCTLGGPQNRAMALSAGTYIKNAHLMRKWLAKPEYDEPVDPAHVAAVVRHYYKAESDGAWEWAGNDPTQHP